MIVYLDLLAFPDCRYAAVVALKSRKTTAAASSVRAPQVGLDPYSAVQHAYGSTETGSDAALGASLRKGVNVYLVLMACSVDSYSG